jgi:lipopolysaccharide export system protein LptA
LRLFEVEAKYIENPVAHGIPQRTLVWHITAPTATHEANGAVDTLDGPLFIQVKDIDGNLLGSGKSDHKGPALRRENEVWYGLAPLHWVQVDEIGKGEYFLPSGWRKEKDDRFVVEHGPVIWNSMGTDIVRELTADSLDAQDLMSGVLKNVNAALVGGNALGGGQIWAEEVEIEGTLLHFLAPLKFEHQNGWRGTATSGVAIRPGGDNSTRALELFDFKASGLLGPEATKMDLSKINVHQAKANEAKWTGAGLQMTGDAQWDLEISEKNENRTRYLLKAPIIFYRVAPGDELPKNIALGAIHSEGSPILYWADNSVRSQTMTYLIKEQVWQLEGQVYVTVPGGNITAGPTSGSASNWIFTGPIRANYQNWGTVQGDRLVWSDRPLPSYIFTGNPVVLSGDAHRLSGKIIIHSNNQLQFTSGIQGNITFQGEMFTLRADNAVIIRDDNIAPEGTEVLIKEVRLVGRVECSAKSYRFSSKEASITFENNQPRRILASGGTSLQGSLGSGVGDSIELIFEQGSDHPNINWSGQVRGKIGVSLGR